MDFLKIYIEINHLGNAETDYPGRITVYGTKPFDSYKEGVSDCFGQYSIMPGVSNKGRPVWKHDSRDDRLFYCKLDWWYIGPKIGTNEFTGKGNRIASTYKIKEGNIPTSWDIWDAHNKTHNTWKQDSSIIVEGMGM